MNDNRTFAITLRIGDKRYRVNIVPEEERFIRDAADEVTDKLAEYREVYAKSDLTPQDVLAMVAFRFALLSRKLREDKDIERFAKVIDEITVDLDNYLKESDVNI